MKVCVRHVLFSFLLGYIGMPMSHAQDYPSKPVEIEVGYAAGGSGDVITRMVAIELTKALGQPFIVVNRPGASGSIAASYVAKAAPNGYTLLSGSSTELAVHYSAFAKPRYNSMQDFVPIIQYSLQPNVLMVKADPTIPVKNVKELIAYAKANPGKVTYGSAGNGSTQHLTAEQFMMLTGVKMLHVPYNGGANVVTDLIGGQIDMNFSPLPEVIEHIKSGRLQALAVTGAERSPLLPNVPTMDEAGVKGYEFTGWHELVAPKGTPKEIVDKLNAVIEKALKGEMGGRLAAIGLKVTGGTPAQAKERLITSVKKFGDLVKASGMPLL
jgi:tripartite-type tricarboxylate transporter receptor subunit TctC